MVQAHQGKSVMEYISMLLLCDWFLNNVGEEKQNTLVPVNEGDIEELKPESGCHCLLKDSFSVSDKEQMWFHSSIRWGSWELNIACDSRMRP